MTTTETISQKFARLLTDEGDWIGCFENHDLGHTLVGHRVAFVFTGEQYDAAEVGKARGPDHQEYGFGWRYLLQLKTRDPNEAERWLAREGDSE